MNLRSDDVMIGHPIRLVRLESQRCHHEVARYELTLCEVAERRADVFVLELTTKLLELDHRLGHLAILGFLTWHINGSRLCHDFTNYCTHIKLCQSR